jgi:hypothetical protein
MRDTWIGGCDREKVGNASNILGGRRLFDREPNRDHLLSTNSAFF